MEFLNTWREFGGAGDPMLEGYIMSCLMWVMGPGVTDMDSLMEVWDKGVPTGVTDTGPGDTGCFISIATRPSLARRSLFRPLNMSTWNCNEINIMIFATELLIIAENFGEN